MLRLPALTDWSWAAACVLLLFLSSSSAGALPSPTLLAPALTCIVLVLVGISRDKTDRSPLYNHGNIFPSNSPERAIDWMRHPGRTSSCPHWTAEHRRHGHGRSCIRASIPGAVRRSTAKEEEKVSFASIYPNASDTCLGLFLVMSLLLLTVTRRDNKIFSRTPNSPPCYEEKGVFLVGTIDICQPCGPFCCV